ncbi:MAG TPA: DUF1080 domain-containing protein [Pirellulaceae bacterium]|nr:DUF1080 domain-containing protein [Pirellulaceae bacterium]
MLVRSVACAVAAALLLSTVHTASAAKGPQYTDAAKADADFAYQGEYLGELQTDNGAVKLGVQVIALGGGKFHAVGYHGGLPGGGWDAKEKKEADGELKDGSVTFKQDDATATLKDGVITITDAAGKSLGTLKKITRESPTLGAKAPAGAIVLFDGKNADAFENGKIEDGLLVQGTTSKQKFADHTLHLEFRTPYAPEERGQGRGNSGLYLQGRYEVQVLDSFGLKGEQNECGGIYSVGAPSVNMCLPPLTWQTYDVDYTAAKYDDAGKLVKHPRVTVKHNGVVIHNDIELPGNRNTTAAPVGASKEPGPVYLQDHGNPVRYRNIWVVEKK